ncbi:MAG TPA: RDD family protein [Pyrinomonadaceae bacterium]|nr:RDD family protein [Pyrinomonadaceae bacterium]
MSANIEQTSRAHAGTATTAAASSSRARSRAAETRAERLRAPFALRCGALLLDYTLLAAVMAAATLVARAFGGGAGVRWGGSGLPSLGYAAVGALALLNFIVLAGFSGRSVGKWVTGLRIERADGRQLSFARALVRHTLGYALTLATLGLGFLVAVFSAEGRALHDFVAGTVVVRHRRAARRRPPQAERPAPNTALAEKSE